MELEGADAEFGGSRCAIWCKQVANREGGCNSNCKQVED